MSTVILLPSDVRVPLALNDFRFLMVTRDFAAIWAALCPSNGFEGEGVAETAVPAF